MILDKMIAEQKFYKRIKYHFGILSFSEFKSLTLHYKETHIVPPERHLTTHVPFLV